MDRLRIKVIIETDLAIEWLAYLFVLLSESMPEI